MSSNSRAKVSVIIPTYNRPQVTEAVKSAIDQSYEDLEIIVVDDHSETPAREYLERYDVEIVRHGENKNGAAARNTGISHAEGDYIAFLDDDDQWKETKIEEQMKKLEESPEDYKACYTKSIFRFPDKEIVREDLPEGDIRKKVLANKVKASFGSSLLIEKELVSEINGFNEEYPRHQDWEFILRLLEKTKICAVNKPLVIRKSEYGENIDVKKAIKAKKIYLEDFKELIESYDVVEARKIYSSHYYEIAKRAAYQGKLRTTLQYTAQSLTNWPIKTPKDYVRLPYYYIRYGLFGRKFN